MTETLKQCVDLAVAQNKGSDAVLRAAREWMLNDKRAARVIPERADSLPPVPPAPIPGIYVQGTHMDGAKRYAEKLKDPRWQRVRLEILNRDDWACTRCGAKTLTLHVHHDRYNGDPWEADRTSLTTICERCHEAEHSAATVTIVERGGKTYQVSTELALKVAAELVRACDEAEAAVRLVTHGRQ
jgi:ribosomal protein S27AE